MKAERFTAVLFLCMTIGTLALAVFSFVFWHTERIMDDSRPIKIDWEKVYPFEGAKKETPSVISSLYDYVKERVQFYVAENLLGYYKIVEAARKCEDIVGWNMVSVFDYNAVVRLKDGYLTAYRVSLDVVGQAEAVKNFADFCTERGIDFMYINFPAKVCKSEDQEISGVLDFTNQNADKFLAMLQELGVRNYDFREKLHEEGINHHESFFVTDHHWKPETGLWAARHILEILHDDLSWDVKPEILSPENFSYKIYRNWFLGSQGKKVSLMRAKPDDFTLITPKYDTKIKLSIAEKKIDTEGDFSAILNYKGLELKNYYDDDAYRTYNMWGGVIRADNSNISNGKKLLVLGDSFCECVMPFLLMGVKYLNAADLRGFNGSIRRYIISEKPDAVAVMYNSTVPGETAPTSRIKNLYDFR